jgi:hypothetical protein
LANSRRKRKRSLSQAGDIVNRAGDIRRRGCPDVVAAAPMSVGECANIFHAPRGRMLYSRRLVYMGKRIRNRLCRL